MTHMLNLIEGVDTTLGRAVSMDPITIRATTFPRSNEGTPALVSLFLCVNSVCKWAFG